MGSDEIYDFLSRVMECDASEESEIDWLELSTSFDR